jgi:hypothetical protein
MLDLRSEARQRLLVYHFTETDPLFFGKDKNAFTPALRSEVAKPFKGLATDVCPFVNVPEAKNGQFLGSSTLEHSSC